MKKLKKRKASIFNKIQAMLLMNILISFINQLSYVAAEAPSTDKGVCTHHPEFNAVPSITAACKLATDEDACNTSSYKCPTALT